MNNSNLRNRILFVNVWQLVLAAFFHLAIGLGIFGAPRLFKGDSLTWEAATTIGIGGFYLILLVLVAIAEYNANSKAAAFRGLLASLLFFPLYILGFSVVWQLGLAGLVYSWTLALHYLRILRQNNDNNKTTGVQHDFSKHQIKTSATIPAKDAITADFIILNSLFAAFLALNEIGYKTVDSPLAQFAMWAFILCLAAVSLPFEYRHARIYEKHFPWLRACLPAIIIAVAILYPRLNILATLLVLRQLVAGIAIWWRTRGGRNLWLALVNRPASLLATSFALAIFIGTLLLTLPAATADNTGLSAVDALFTSTSATCVTGLIVVDTGTTLSIFGQLTVLTLIQAGGLGIMTISIFVALLLGRSIGLRGEFALKETIGEQRTRSAVNLLKFIVAATFMIELTGAAILYFSWHELDVSIARRAYIAIFHSISAFCNAGFSLFSDSLYSFQSNPGVVLTVSILIILGGLGFSVLYLSIFSTRNIFANLHVRMVLTMTFLLIVAGTALFWSIECWHGNWNPASLQSLLNAWFQSVTTRTAGFNSVDLPSLNQTTLTLMMIFMFIGAAPGSTAGGIKVTTAAVLLLTIRSVLTGHDTVTMNRRRVSQTTVMNAAALLCLALIAVGTAVIMLMLTQNIAPSSILFEAFSAFGTVGLSIGATAELNISGKLIIVSLMFIGRTGPLTLLLIMRPRRKPKCQYPSADVMVG